MSNDNIKSMPRIVRKGLIECPKCGWKQSDENEQCSWCDYIFPKLDKPNNDKSIDNNQHKNYSKFKLNKLIIKAPSNYIYRSERIKLKQNGEFFELITNLDKLDFNPRDIINHSEDIISIANDKFLTNEGVILKREFKNDLKNHEGLITDSDKEKFKEKYNKRYCKYYIYLNFDYLIGEHNEKIINNEKEIYQNDFIKKLSGCKHIISDSEREKFKIEYNKDYCKFYDVLGFDELINDFNNNIIKKKKLKIVADLKEGYISQSEKMEMQRGLDFDLDDIIDEHNEEYIKKQMEINKSYFENIDGKSLDNDQIKAVLTDDDVTQIVAGAGTGKTMTIQAKIKYLIEKQNISPSDILCISYSNSACDDLASKLEKTLGDNIIDVRTFHSVGFSILRDNGPHMEVPSNEIDNLVELYFKEVILEKPGLIKEVIEFFSYYYDLIFLNQSNLDFETIKYKINKLDEFEEVLQEEMGIFKDEEKEYVHSIYDLIIANYLFIHNINYKISQKLVVKKNLFEGLEDIIPNHLKQELIAKVGNKFIEHDCYCNFYLPEMDIYINLLNFKPNWKECVDNKEEIIEYLGKIDKINRTSETKILNIYDYGSDIEYILNNLDDYFDKLGFKTNELDYSQLFKLLIVENNLKEYNDFIKTVKTFINLFKGNAYNIDDEGNDISKSRFKQYLKENSENYTGALEKRNRFFLKIIEKIYHIYVQKIRDGHYIDFNDMINNAVIALRKGAKIHDYKYIIVDEYQDTSYTRYSLLKEMQNSTGAKIVVVGDDWQSIYGFTGCDVSLFSKFNEYFEDSKMVKIEVTYRNSQDLIDVCGKFMKDNKNLIWKELKSAKGPRNKPIKLVEYTSRSEAVLSLMSILDEISQKNEEAEILILGRNNGDKSEIACKDILAQYEHTDFTKIIYTKNPKLDIKFRTVHKSKGLQADYVIILNLNDKINGFPNKMVNDAVLDFVDKKYDENVEYPEERRLFYVALTRTENDVYVFHNSLRPSCFIEDIEDNDKVRNLKFSFSNEDIHKISLLLNKKYDVLETELTCPKCNSGKIKLIINNERGTSGFKCSNNCGWDGGSYHNINKGDHARKISHLKYARVCEFCQHMLVVTPRKINPKIKFLGCNHFPICRNADNLPRDFVDIDYTKFKLDKTRNDVYYLYKYIPPEKMKDYTQDEIDVTEKIWGYKDADDEYLISLFTKEIMEAVTLLVNKKVDDEIKKIALVSVPSSKVENRYSSTMRKTLNIIETWNKSGITEQNFGCEKEIINCKDVLTRVVDVPTAHLGEGRANCKEHVKSIECNVNQLPDDDAIFIILDDVTTSGETMKACKQILIENDIEEENIYTLAIGATVRGKNEEI